MEVTNKNKNATLYSRKIIIPKFEPDDRNLTLDDVADFSKYNELVEEINQYFERGDITDEERKFLIFCASRWIRFHYGDVAQYYSTNASPSMKRLMERSAMVLVDFDNAFEEKLVIAKEFTKKISKEFFEKHPEQLNYTVTKFEDEI